MSGIDNTMDNSKAGFEQIVKLFTDVTDQVVHFMRMETGFSEQEILIRDATLGAFQHTSQLAMQESINSFNCLGAPEQFVIEDELHTLQVAHSLQGALSLAAAVDQNSVRSIAGFKEILLAVLELVINRVRIDPILRDLFRVLIRAIRLIQERLGDLEKKRIVI
jgi:hypothetical protein